MEQSNKINEYRSISSVILTIERNISVCIVSSGCVCSATLIIELIMVA